MGRKPIAALFVLSLAPACAATRPHYGGTLRVETHEAVESADPPQSGRGMGDLNAAFNITQWIAGSRAVYAADENAPGGRPFIDTIEITMGRSLADQAIDLQLGKADVVESDLNEPRRLAAAARTWSSAPVRLLVLTFGRRVEDVRVREALALSLDRAAMHRVILQRQGEVSAALLPQWVSGYAFVFPTAQDLPRARALLAGIPPAAHTLSIAAADPANRRLADRIAVDAKDAGLTLLRAASGNADVRLVETRVLSTGPARALAGIAAALGLAEPPHADSPEALYAAERGLLDGFRVIPLFHLPDVYGVNPRVKGGSGISPLGEWRFENLWLEAARP